MSAQPKVLKRVSGALRKLSANPEHKHEVAEEDGIQMLLKASQKHLADAVVQAGVMGVLCNLSVDDEIEQTVADAGGVEQLIRAAQVPARGDETHCPQEPMEARQ